MRLATGKVVQGRVELIGDSLDEGTVVTVAVPDEEFFQIDAESEAALLQSIEEADRGELIPVEGSSASWTSSGEPRPSHLLHPASRPRDL